MYGCLSKTLVSKSRSRPSEKARARRAVGAHSGRIRAAVLSVCAFFVLFLGIFPNEGSLPLLGMQLPVVDWARYSVEVLFPPG